MTEQLKHNPEAVTGSEGNIGKVTVQEVLQGHREGAFSYRWNMHGVVEPVKRSDPEAWPPEDPYPLAPSGRSDAIATFTNYALFVTLGKLEFPIYTGDVVRVRYLGDAKLVERMPQRTLATEKGFQLGLHGIDIVETSRGSVVALRCVDPFSGIYEIPDPEYTIVPGRYVRDVKPGKTQERKVRVEEVSLFDQHQIRGELKARGYKGDISFWQGDLFTS